MAARALAVLTDTLFAQLRSMPDKKPDAKQFLDDFMKSPDLRLRLKMAGMQLALEEQQEQLNMQANEIARHSVQQEQEQMQHERELSLVRAVVSSEPSKSRSDTPSISEAFAIYMAFKVALGRERQPGGWKDGEDTAKYDHWPHVERLIEIVGRDKPIGMLTDEDARNFLKDTVDQIDVKALTKDKRLSRVRAFLTWANEQRYLANDLTSILKWAGKLKANHYQPFSADDIKRLFESGDYKNGGFTKAWQYWLPLLGLFSGARLNELAQLRTGDISSREGIPCLLIHDDDGRRVKNEASIRTIPIHPKLIELGFLTFVERRRVSGKDRLFDLPENKQKPGDFSKEPSRFFTGYRRRVGVTGAPERYEEQTDKWIGKSSKTFHSFRTTAISELRRVLVPQERRKRLVGHAEGDVHNDTYRPEDLDSMFPMGVLLVDLGKLTFDIDFSLPPEIAR